MQIYRALAWVRALGTAASQLWHVLVVGPVAMLLGGAVPDPDETFSAMLGRRAAAGAWRANHVDNRPTPHR